MTDFSFLHAADLHLDTPFKGISRVSPGIADLLRDASLDAFDRLVELAVKREVAFVLLAGDIYDGAERGIRAQLRFLKGLERLDEYGIPIFIVHGNHDPLDGWSAIREWPASVTIFPSDAVRGEPVVLDGERIATVYGISYPTRDVRENLALRYRRGEAPGLHVGLLHANVGGDPEHASYAPCAEPDLQAAGIDYWALGHVHKREILRPGDPWIVYPGNTQGRSPKPSERGAKGCYVVPVRGGRVMEPEFVALDGVRFAEIGVPVDDVADLPGLTEALRAEAREEAVTADGRTLIVRATLRGRGPVHDDLRREESLDSLLEELRGGGDARSTVWWDSLSDRTGREIDREVVRDRGDFLADVVALSDALAAEPARLAEWSGEVGKVQHWLGAEAPDLAELLPEAEALALDLLEGDAG